MKISPFTERMEPYVAGEQPKDRAYVKLNTNENPYPPSPAVRAAIEKVAANAERLKLYPDPTCGDLKKAIAKKEGVSERAIFCGNGSDEVLAFCFAAFYRGLKPAICDITYSFYPVFCAMFGITPTVVPLLPDMSVDISRLIKSAKDGAVIANPNAPTTKSESAESIIKIADGTDCAVVVDEAYVDFSSRPSLVPLVAERDNIVAVKTLSKSYSLAGLRVGYAIGSRQAVEALERVRDSINSYTVDAIAQAAGAAAISDCDYHKKTVERIVKERAEVIRALDGIKTAEGNTVTVATPEPDTNFYLMKASGMSGQTLYERLKEKGVLVRYLSSLPDLVRVTVGSAEQNAALLKAVKEL